MHFFSLFLPITSVMISLEKYFTVRHNEQCVLYDANTPFTSGNEQFIFPSFFYPVLNKESPERTDMHDLSYTYNAHLHMYVHSHTHSARYVKQFIPVSLAFPRTHRTCIPATKNPQLRETKGNALQKRNHQPINIFHSF